MSQVLHISNTTKQILQELDNMELALAKRTRAAKDFNEIARLNLKEASSHRLSCVPVLEKVAPVLACEHPIIVQPKDHGECKRENCQCGSRAWAELESELNTA